MQVATLGRLQHEVLLNAQRSHLSHRKHSSSARLQGLRAFSCICRASGSLQRWAVEAAQYGTFTAALADEQASSNIGGLPVPALCIGTRRDLLVGLNPSVLHLFVHHEKAVHSCRMRSVS